MAGGSRMSFGSAASVMLLAVLAVGRASGARAEEAPPDPGGARRERLARQLVRYFEMMTEAPPLRPRSGELLAAHRRALRAAILSDIALSPLPERIPLAARETDAIELPDCTVRRVYYDIWPGVTVSGLLWLPATRAAAPRAGVLCPHGHWSGGNTHPTVQTRCRMLARLGYVVFSPRQHHHENLALGISHQTVTVWSNLRAIDYLQSRSDVDPGRIGVCGASGGGLQTQMLLALDDRVKAAVIAGLTCRMGEILFPHATHCGCNHFPRVLRRADFPELSALGVPTPVLYLTMRDWTAAFGRDDLPAIRALYAANGAADRVAWIHEETPHEYGRSKREATYRWLGRWLRGNGGAVEEPEDLPPLPPARLTALRREEVVEDRFQRIDARYAALSRPDPEPLAGTPEWRAWREREITALRRLLGEAVARDPESSDPEPLGIRAAGGLVEERVDVVSEGSVRVPVRILRKPGAGERRPVAILCADSGAAPGGEMDLAGRRLAEGGWLVALADVRFTGELSPRALALEIRPSLLARAPVHPLGVASARDGQARNLRAAWTRNSIVWGRPIAGMAATDLRAVLDLMLARPDADRSRVQLRARGEVAAGALFAALLDPRFLRVELDLEGRSWADGTLAPVPFVLRRGDVGHWRRLLGDRSASR